MSGDATQPAPDGAAPPLETLSVGAFLDRLAARAPVPGGGASAAVTLGQSAALARMVLAYTIGKPRFAEHAAVHEAAEDELRQFQERALELAEADARGYARLNALFGLDREDPERRASWRDAVDGAIAAPRAMTELGADLATLLDRLLGTTSRMLRSDLAIAAVLVDAGARAAAWNVRINLPLLEDDAAATVLSAELDDRLAATTRLASAVEHACTA